MKPFQRFYYTQAWRKCRDAFVKSKGGLCELCLSRGIYKPIEEVHHKIHLNADNINDPNITLNWDNLMGLCHDCHMEVHSSAKVVRYEVDAQGNVRPR